MGFSRSSIWGVPPFISHHFPMKYPRNIPSKIPIDDGFSSPQLWKPPYVFMIVHRLYPLVNEQFAIENGPLILDLPIKILIFHSYASLPVEGMTLQVAQSHQCLFQDLPVADLLRRCCTIDLRFLKGFQENVRFRKWEVHLYTFIYYIISYHIISYHIISCIYIYIS